MKKQYRLAAIGGAGMIGHAVLSGVLQQKLLAPSDIIVTARHQRTLDKVTDLKVDTSTDNCHAVQNAEALLLAVHPNQALDVIRGCQSFLTKGQLLISVVTGIRVSELQEAAGNNVRVIRTMPNIAAIVGASVTSITAGPRVTQDDLDFASALFGAVGTTHILDESHLNACTGLAGCGPAFAFKVIESLASGGIKMGLPRDVSRTMAAGVLLGAAKLVLETGRHPAALKDDVTTPGGCTIDGLAMLEERGMPSAIISAVEASTRKAALLDRKAQDEKQGNS